MQIHCFRHFYAAVLVTFLLLGITPVIAQSLPAGADPGRVQERFDEPRAPSTQPRVRRGLESTTAPSEAAAYQLRLNSVTVVGSTVYATSDFSNLYQDLISTTVSLSEVFAIAARITAKYGEDGYILSRAIVPPQALEPSGADIRIEIIEGYVDEVVWPDTVVQYRDLFSEYTAKITADRPLNNQTLERYLLLANDLPGLSFESNLVASATNPGASKLIITGTETPFDGYVSADNHGVEASGPYQVTLNAGVNNLARNHERLEVAFVAAGLSEDDDTELSYASWDYHQVLNSEGLTWFFEGNWSDGTPGTTALLAANFNTEGFNVSSGFIYPFIKTRAERLDGTIAFDFKNSESVINNTISTRDRLRIIRAGLDYENADDSGGTNQLSVFASLGVDGLGSTSNNNPVASRNPGVVDFFKVIGSIARTQQLQNRFSLYAAAFGQWTNDPLLSSQECGYGGRTYGRGFDASIITGDRCFMGTAELRHNLALSGQLAEYLSYLQPYAFIDYGHISNINAPLGTPTNDEGSSAGAGIRFGNDTFTADLTISTIVNEPNSQPNLDDTRGWFKLTWRY